MDLKHIAAEVIQELPETKLLNFEQDAKPWIGNNKILSYKVNPNKGNVIIVTHDKEQSIYDIIRLFPGGQRKWNVSMDYQGGDIGGMTKRLLDYQ